MPTIRRLEPPEGALFREIRLEALTRAPDSFGSILAEESSLPLERFSERVATEAIWCAFEADRCVGVVCLQRETAERKAHKGTLRGMYVAPEARGSGAAEGLIRALLDHAAAEGVQTVLLTVKAVNTPARRLYQRMGFSDWGLEPRSLRIGDDYFDDVHMWKPL